MRREERGERVGGNIKTFSLQAVADAERQKAVLEIKIQEQRIKVLNIYMRISVLKQQQSPGRG